MLISKKTNNSRTEEIWEAWKPDTNLSEIKQLSVAAIYDIIGIFYIDLIVNKDKKKQIRILYEQSVESYRRTSAMLMKKDVSKFADGSQEFNGSIFRVINSNYINWLSKESFGMVDESEYIHLVFAGENHFVDVIAGYEPKITVLFSSSS